MTNRRQTWGVIVGIAVAVLVGAGGYWVATAPQRTKQRAADLWVPPSALNIGTVWEADSFEWTLPIVNREQTSVNVDSFSSSCNCTTIEPRSFALEPGERRELRLRIDLRSQLRSTGEINVSLLPQLAGTADLGAPKKISPVWKISGQVRRIVALDRQVYLGRHSELAQPKLLQPIVVEVLVPLKSLSAECDVRGLVASVERSDERKALLRLKRVAPLPLGAIEGTVVLKPILEGGEELPAQRVRCSGKIVPDVEAVPPAVEVGGRRLGEAFENVVTLRSLTGCPFTTLRADMDGEGLAVDRLEESGNVLIRQKVCKIGSQSNRVVVRVQSGGREVLVTVPVRYTGVEDR